MAVILHLKVLMKYLIIFLLTLITACGSNSVSISGSNSGDQSVQNQLPEETYNPISEGLIIEFEETQSTKPDQMQIILNEVISSFPIYQNENSKKYEKKLAESYRKAKDALDSYYKKNLDAIKSKFIEYTYEELLDLESFISVRYITVMKALAKEFIEVYFIYKQSFTSSLLNIEAFDYKLVFKCDKDSSDSIELEIDNLDDFSTKLLREYWGGNTFKISNESLNYSVHQAELIAEDLEELREILYKYTHCKSRILTAQKLYQFLLNSNNQIFKTKNLTRDPQKAEKQADLISVYVEDILKLASSNDYSYKLHGKLAKQHSRSFEAKMILYGPWAEKKLINESIQQSMYIALSEKFLEHSYLSDEKFYAGIRCNMVHYNHFEVNNNQNKNQGPFVLVPLSVKNCN